MPWIFLTLIKSHKTLTNICTAFVNSTTANFFSCHWWQETDDIITVPPTHSNPVPFDFEGCISHNGRESQERATIHNRLQILTWKKLWRAHSLQMCSSSYCTDSTTLPFCHAYTSFTLLHISLLFPCCLLCISSSAVSQALNSICTFPLMLAVLHSAGKTSTGCTDPQCICRAEVSVFECIFECDLSSMAPRLISCLPLFHRFT